jgi:hypothetical protein
MICTIKIFETVGNEPLFLFTKIEFGGSFGMSLEGDCYECEVTPN